MERYKQRVFGQKRGSCLKTCVACILDIPMSKVPNFNAYGSGWWGVLWRWFKKQGYSVLVPAYDKKLVPKNKPYIVTGISPRGNFMHAVIYKNFKPYHDPHPDNTFIEGSPLYIYVIKKLKNNV